jgi:hypothetical protein
MANERIEYILSDKEDPTADATSKSAQQVFTPGIQTVANASNQARQLDANWPKEFVVKTGNPIVDNAGGIQHLRVVKTERNTVCDQTIPAPIVLGTETRSQTISGGTSTWVYTDTVTQDNNGTQERNSGGERIKQ